MATTPTPVLPKLVGSRIKRREDPRLIQGRATYVDDLKIAGMHHLAFKRSDIAHGRIKSIDVSAAQAMEGVEAVFTGTQLVDLIPPMPVGTPYRTPEHRAIATDTVRYAGEPVAVVVARDRYLARDAADAIVVTYDPLPVVVDPELAMTGKPTLVHEGFPNNLLLDSIPGGTGAAGGTVDDSAIDKAFAAADVVISQRMVNHRLAPSAMEPRGVVAHFEPGKGTMTIWSSTQSPHVLRSIIAAMFGMGQDQVRAVAPEVGGGFGAKINVYGEEFVAAALSRKLELPIKWIEDRSEAFVATIHGRDILGYVDLAAKRDGTVLGLKLRLIADVGAYNMLFTAMIPTLTMLMANATYDIPAIRVTLSEVFTNKTPTDAYRGAGRPEATYFVERAMDLLARELGMEPADVRRKNFIKPGQFPYQTQMGAVYDSGDYEKALDHALKVADWARMKRAARRRPGRGSRGRHRAGDVRGGLRAGALLSPAHRRLGACAGDRGARRPDQRHHRRVAARPGQRDHLRADARRPVRGADRAHHDPPRRHRGRQAGHRHVRQPIAGRGRCGHPFGRRQGEDQDGQVRRGPARSARGRPRVRERPRLGGRRAGVRQVVRRGGVVRLRAGAAAAGTRTGTERGGLLRTDQRHVSLRLPHLDARDRSRHRRAQAAEARGRG